MTKYRAIVSITFDDADLQEIANEFGVGNVDPHEALNGSLDNLDFGSGWIEQLFADGSPQICRMSGGIDVEVDYHD